MKILNTSLPEVLILQPTIYGDQRGYTYESFNQKKFACLIGMQTEFVQDNHSFSKKGVLRGLHFQSQQSQAKLVRAVRGSIFDVAVDVRRDSVNFGRWTGLRLTESNQSQLWIPTGFAHGFIAMSEHVEVIYKVSEYYSPNYEHTIAWNDPSIGIEWPLQELGISVPILSDKDTQGLTLDAFS